MWEKIASKWKKKLWWRYSLGSERGPTSNTHPEPGEWEDWGGFPKDIVLELSFKELVR